MLRVECASKNWESRVESSHLDIDIILQGARVINLRPLQRARIIYLRRLQSAAVIDLSCHFSMVGGVVVYVNLF